MINITQKHTIYNVPKKLSLRKKTKAEFLSLNKTPKSVPTQKNSQNFLTQNLEKMVFPQFGKIPQNIPGTLTQSQMDEQRSKEISNEFTTFCKKQIEHDKELNKELNKLREIKLRQTQNEIQLNNVRITKTKMDKINIDPYDIYRGYSLSNMIELLE
jgi:hypothetical protein